MKVEKTLALAIARNLTTDQQAELAALINNFVATSQAWATAVGNDKLTQDQMDSTLVPVNAAWSALCSVGLPVRF